MTGERLYPCRMPPNGVSTLIHTKRRFCRLRDMQQNRPEGSMEVAIDTNPHGSKRYTYFADPTEFFMDTFAVVHRNYYELIPPNQPCCLYFDLEHYTAKAHDDNKLQCALEVIQQQAERRWSISTSCWETVVILTASRQVPTGYKHSFHVIYPCIGFSCNHRLMREFARDLSLMPELQALNKQGSPCSLLDVNVYNKNQAFRVIESWKYALEEHPDMALRFLDKRPHTMEHLLQTVVRRPHLVHFWVPESTDILPTNNGHNAGIDGLHITTVQSTCLDTICPCSGLAVTFATRIHIKKIQGGWLLRCAHEVCKIAKKTEYRVSHSFRCRGY